tara:strand:+ start:117 stop:1082 length:966 start_codon:yes stop_codon:yes gene_type:complete
MNFLKPIKKFIKTFFYSILNREGKKIKFYSNLLLTNKFHLLDIGAAGEINNRWTIIKKNIILNLAEPHKKSAIELKNRGHNVIEKIFYNKENLNLTFYETKNPECSSIIKPNLEYVNNFSKSERFEIQKKIQVKTTTIDYEFKLDKVPNFVKIDTQGSELEILKGSTKSLKSILGLEIECEFFQLYENQPLFTDIQKFLDEYNFVLIDFLRICRWESKKYRFTGQPQFADVLFLKKPDLILNEFKNKSISEELFLKYIVILIIYNRPDLIGYLIDNLEANFIEKFRLNKIYDLVEKKIYRLNIFEKYYYFIRGSINNLIKV